MPVSVEAGVVGDTSLAEAVIASVGLEANGHCLSSALESLRDLIAAEAAENWRAGVWAVVHGDDIAADSAVGAAAGVAGLECDV